PRRGNQDKAAMTLRAGQFPRPLKTTHHSGEYRPPAGRCRRLAGILSAGAMFDSLEDAIRMGLKKFVLASRQNQPAGGRCSPEVAATLTSHRAALFARRRCD